MSNRTIQANVTAKFEVTFEDNGLETLVDQAHDAALEQFPGSENMEVSICGNFTEQLPINKWKYICFDCNTVSVLDVLMEAQKKLKSDNPCCPNCGCEAFDVDKEDTYVTE